MSELLYLNTSVDHPGIRTGTVRFRADLDRLAARAIPSFRSRRDFGRGCRKALGRSAQGIFKAADRTGLIERLKAFNDDRVPELLPVKYGRMASSPFTFFRGSVGLMAEDLAAQPVTGLSVLMCGDAHVQNLGAFAAPDGHLVFDLNDFDESYPGPWEWDVKRMTASVVLAGREAGNSEVACTAAVHALVRAYRNTLDQLARLNMRDLVRYDAYRNTLQMGPVANVLRKAARSSLRRLMKKITEPGGTFPQLAERPPLLAHLTPEAAQAVLDSLPAYRAVLGADRQAVLDAYTPWDVAFKVVGTGSVGTHCYVLLLYGHGPDDPLFLQIKESRPSPYVPHVPGVPPVVHEGERVAHAQHRLQTVTDPFLGWTKVGDVPCIVRQLNDHKAGIDTAELRGRALSEYATVSGEILAKGHARTGDAAALSGYCGRSDALDVAMAAYARACADQSEVDHKTLVQAIKRGAVEAVRA